MESLRETLGKLPDEHRQALEWFNQHKGHEVPWKTIQEHAESGPRLAAQAKGIYKPHYTNYALSARTLQEGPYPDKDVEHRLDGSWVVQYFQENPDPGLRDREATNRGLMQCMSDGVPIGFLVKRKPKPGVTYEVLGLGMVTGWNNGYFTIEGLADDGSSHTAEKVADAARSRASHAVSDVPDAGDFDADNEADLRERTMSTVAKRRGQAKFRAQLLELYEGRCAITGCDFTEALEAAHILPYRGDHSNHPCNGILLRADLHTLFDLGHISVSDDYRVVMTPQATAGESYSGLDGKEVKLPTKKVLRPSLEALQSHRKWSGL